MDNLVVELKHLVVTQAVPILYRIAGAIVLWLVGRSVIGGLKRAMAHELRKKQDLDPTLIRYVESIVSTGLTILLILAVFGVFGVDTTSFAALLAAVGIAIGTAWSGLLANFAAGVFLVVLRPFHVGDTITAAGVSGVVHEIGLFATTLDTGENVRVFVGNNKIFSDVIQNFSANPYRRVEARVQLPGSIDASRVVTRLREELPHLPGVLAEPQGTVEFIDLTPVGPVIQVRPFTTNSRYGDVVFAVHETVQRLIRDERSAPTR